MPKIVQFKDGTYALRRRKGFLWMQFSYADLSMHRMSARGGCQWHNKIEEPSIFNSCCKQPYLQTVEDFFEERKRRMKAYYDNMDDFGRVVKKPKEKKDEHTKLAEEPTAADLQTF